MSEKVRDAVTALIRAEQSVPQGSGTLHHLSRMISKPGGESWETAELTLSFGKGYFDWSRVFVRVDDRPAGEAEVDEAAAAYSEARVPAVMTAAGGTGPPEIAGALHPAMTVEDFRREAVELVESALGRWLVQGDSRRLLSALRTYLPTAPAEELQKILAALPR